MEQAYITGGARSYIGTENGMYKNIPAEILGAEVIKHIINKYNIKDIDMVVAGNATGAGGNITRLMILEAGLPENIPAFTIDMQCGSGLESIAVAAARIQSGQSGCVIAGGFESCSTAPMRAYNKNHPGYNLYGQSPLWYKTAKFSPGKHEQDTMLKGAEMAAVSEGITRDMLDKWVLRSHMLAKETRDKGILNNILVQVKGGCTKDEGIRDRMSQRLLDRIPCVLNDGSVITAANACLTNDGAAFVVMCSGSYIKEHGIKPVAEFMDIAETGASPDKSPCSVVPAIDKLLKRNKLDYHNIDIYECNEAFAVIDELFARKYPDVADRYNVFGGALAYGHPYGASGGIIMLHALKALEKEDTNINNSYAVCSIAAAGGVGTAVLVRRGNRCNGLL